MALKRDASLVRLSRDHHRGLVWGMRFARELPTANEAEVAALYAEFLLFWESGLLPHFRAECECLLARLARRLAGQGDVLARTQSDHLEINSLMAGVRDDDDPVVRRQALAEIGDLLRKHIRWEESVLFELTQTALTERDLAALAADVAERIPEMPPPPPWPGHQAG